MISLRFLLIVSFLFRLALGLTLDFGVDESYMLAQAAQFQWSYVDHPPLHVWVAGMMQSIFGVSKIIRLPFILAFTLTSWVLFCITKQLYNTKAALWSVIALNLSAFFIISPGLLIVPDGLLILFLALSTYAFINHRFIQLGIYLGLAGLSKYHAALFGISLLAYILIYERHLLKNPLLWFGGIITLAMQTPIIIWNFHNEWVSIAFQAGRGGIYGFKPNQFLQMSFGQFFLLMPWVAVPLVISAYKLKKPTLLLWLALPIILLFSFTPLWGRRGQAHWTMAGWFFLFPFLGAWLSTRIQAPRWARWSASALLIIPLIVLQAKYALIPFKNDATREISAYNDLPPPPDYIITVDWKEAGKIWVYYQGKVPVFIIGNDQRNFGINRSMKGLEDKKGLLITSYLTIDGLSNAVKTHYSSFNYVETRLMKRGEQDTPLKLHIYSLQDLIRPFNFTPFGANF